jgi:hypothetical protein
MLMGSFSYPGRVRVSRISWRRIRNLVKSYGCGWKRRPRNINSHVYVRIIVMKQGAVNAQRSIHHTRCFFLSSLMSTSRRPLSSPHGAASELIHTIRAGHGFDDDPSARHPAVPELRGKLERALERLSNDLYNKKTHFLLEVIQNADDNMYGASIVPTLRLRIEDRFVVFECNELGFKAANVVAICDIGRSTKPREKNPRGFIGAFCSVSGLARAPLTSICRRERHRFQVRFYRR